MIANRGSATARDWLITDPQVVIGVRETLADISAKKFADYVINTLDKQNKEIKVITTTGHSLGGREAQMTLAHLTGLNIPNIECQSLTFNSIGVHKQIKQENQQCQHINLQVTGNLPLISKDLVSEIRSQLEENFHIPMNVGNLITAHKMGTVAKIIEQYSGTSQLSTKDILAMVKQGMDIQSIHQSQTDQKQLYAAEQTLQNSIFVAKEIENQILIPATPGIHTGKIIMENANQVFQQLENSQKYVIIHEKEKLDQIPKVGWGTQ